MSTTTVLVTYRGSTREVALPSDSQLESLWENFSAAFSEFMPPGIEPTQGIFTEILKHGVKLHATLEEEPFPIIPHPLNDNDTYNFWSLISKQNGSLMKRNGTVINCKGGKKVGESNLVNIKAKPANVHDTTHFRLELNGPTKSTKVYVITGRREGQDVYVQEVDASTTPPKDNESRFQAIYYYSYTQFLCSRVDCRDDLYLASDENGKVTLAKDGPLGYPNPSTLFICNQIV